ncbi:hypothetical protein ACFQ0G_53650 [Streptomyces chiangmaiensis]
MLDIDEQAEFPQVAGVVKDRAPFQAELAGRRLSAEREVPLPVAPHSFSEDLSQQQRRAAGPRMESGTDHELRGREEVLGTA